MRKISIIALATAAISVGFAGAASAVTVFTTSGAGNNNVVWNGSTLTVTDTAGAFVGKSGYFASNDTFSGETTSIVFTGSSLSYNSVTGAFTENLGAGTFTTTGPGGTISGTIAAGDSFSGSTLPLGSSQPFTFTNVPGDVTYSSTALFNSSGLLSTGGGFSIEAPDSVTPSPYVVTGGVLQSFSVADSTTFTALTATPEPASVATFGIGAMALMLLAGLARRRNANSTL